MDQYFTPPGIANCLVSAANNPRRGTVIADFAAGKGELLIHAERRWPNRSYLANDIDPVIVRGMRKDKPAWTVANCDFLNDNSRNRSRLLSTARNRVGLCLLNPPFSCRGNETWPVKWKGNNVRCSLALAFVIAALEFSGPDAELLAILPTGTTQSDKDAIAWKLIGQHCRYRVVAENPHRAFKSCVVRTIIMSIRKLDSDAHASTQLAVMSSKRTATIMFSLQRGNLPAANRLLGDSNKSCVPFIHTTDIKANSVSLLGKIHSMSQYHLTGPSVLLPRVGTPDRRKVALYLGETPVTLSDCIIGIECVTNEDALAIHSALLKHWPLVASSYGGTCARYITLSTVKALLIDFGFEACANISIFRGDSMHIPIECGKGDRLNAFA